MQEFDENAAVKYINSALYDKFKVTYPDDEILNIIDMIWDWYDENGLTDIDFNDDDQEEEVETEIISAYVRKLLAKDSDSPVDPAHIDSIVEAEIEYENSLDPLA